jgi:ATP synthase protein I
VFAYKAFRYAGARASKEVMQSFFSGVKLKLGLTALLLALALKFLVIIPLPFFWSFMFGSGCAITDTNIFKNFKF